MKRFAYAALALLCASSICFALEAPKPAQRIIALAPNLTELAFAAGAGEQLVGVAQYSDEPVAAKKIQRIGDAFRVDFEKILSLKPDLVLAWSPGTPQANIDKLRSFHLTVAVIRTGQLAEIADALRTIGQLAGTANVAETQAKSFEARLSAMREKYSSRAPLRVLLEIQHQPLYTISGKQIISEIIRDCGGRNIFAALGHITPVVGVESVLAADPEVIISMDETLADPKAEWAKFPSLTAVRNGKVFKLPAALLSQATPRMLDGMRATCEALDAARGH